MRPDWTHAPGFAAPTPDVRYAGLDLADEFRARFAAAKERAASARAAYDAALREASAATLHERDLRHLLERGVLTKDDPDLAAAIEQGSAARLKLSEARIARTEAADRLRAVRDSWR